MTNDFSKIRPLFVNSVVYELPYEGNVRKGISYADNARVFDIYLPEEVEEPAPVVVLVTGYPDLDFEERVGMKQMGVQSYKDWATLLAASGMAAVIYSNVEPIEDVFTLLDFLRCEADQLQIDPARIAVWSCSGNVPNAINVLHKDSAVRCAALLYGFMLDTMSSSVVRETAQELALRSGLSETASGKCRDFPCPASGSAMQDAIPLPTVRQGRLLTPTRCGPAQGPERSPAPLTERSRP